MTLGEVGEEKSAAFVISDCEKDLRWHQLGAPHPG